MNDTDRVLQLRSIFNELSNKQARLEGKFDVIKKAMLDKYNIADINLLIEERDKVCAKEKELREELDSLLNDTEKLLSM